MLWIILATVLLAIVAGFYGWRALSSVLLFAGALLAKDAIGHFWGKKAEWIFVSLFAVVCITIYVINRRKRDQNARHKHHSESESDTVA
jgi:membrane protein implicated in regulation of membrane protease activity